MLFLGKIRKILGALTDLLLKGRQAGLYTEDHSSTNTSPLDKPHRPGEKIK